MGQKDFYQRGGWWRSLGGVATKLQAEQTAEAAKGLDRKITDRKMGANDTQKGGSDLTTDKTGFTRMGRTEGRRTKEIRMPNAEIRPAATARQRGERKPEYQTQNWKREMRNWECRSKYRI